MQAVFDVATRTLTLPDFASYTHGGVLEGIARIHGTTVPVNSLGFSVKMDVGGSRLTTFEYPPTGVYVREIGGGAQELKLTSIRLRWRPEDSVSIAVSLITATDTHTKTAAFTAPRPARPYTSWTWNSTLRAWQPPTEYPTDGRNYVWDESVPAWVVSTE